MQMMGKKSTRNSIFHSSALLLVGTGSLALSVPFFGWISLPVHAAETQQAAVVETAFAGSAPIAIAFMFSILALKITAFVLGYLIVRLGHDTLIKGISGEIDFGFSGSGFTTKLKSGSPGALFVVMGAAIIIWGLMVQKPMEIKVIPSSPAVLEQETQQQSVPLHRTPVPD